MRREVMVFCAMLSSLLSPASAALRGNIYAISGSRAWVNIGENQGLKVDDTLQLLRQGAPVGIVTVVAVTPQGAEVKLEFGENFKLLDEVEAIPPPQVTPPKPPHSAPKKKPPPLPSPMPLSSPSSKAPPKDRFAHQFFFASSFSLFHESVRGTSQSVTPQALGSALGYSFSRFFSAALGFDGGTHAAPFQAFGVPIQVKREWDLRLTLLPSLAEKKGRGRLLGLLVFTLARDRTCAPNFCQAGTHFEPMLGGGLEQIIARFRNEAIAFHAGALESLGSSSETYFFGLTFYPRFYHKPFEE